jgi:hypothetical protein
VSYDHSSDALKLFTNATEKARIDSSGRLLVGTSTSRTADGYSSGLQLEGATNYQSASISLTHNRADAGAPEFRFCKSRGTSVGAVTLVNSGDILGRLYFYGTDGSAAIQAARISAEVGGTPGANDMPGRLVFSTTADGASSPTERMRIDSAGTTTLTSAAATAPFIAKISTTEAARIDSSGRLLVGTSTSVSQFGVQPQIQSTGTSGAGGYLGLTVFNTAADSASNLVLGHSKGGSIGTYTASVANDLLGEVSFTAANGTDMRRGAAIGAFADAGWGTSDHPARLIFSTTADGASSPTERMRIDSQGNVYIGTTSTSPAFANITGATIRPEGILGINREGISLSVGRKGTDGTLVEFYQDGTLEGTISVSGTTVSYNGAHLSRWSQLPGGVERAEILRGTVLSNIDEMCGWGDEDNEQLNRMKVSDVESDPNVAGVFQSWDDDDDTYADDFYCAMTGDFIIRIAEGVTVQRGDLLMSAGDGTAKPQDDDIIRSKTIAKVTSTHVTCTYDDGSYCVPCVLMAC